MSRMFLRAGNDPDMFVQHCAGSSQCCTAAPVQTAESKSSLTLHFLFPNREIISAGWAPFICVCELLSGTRTELAATKSSHETAGLEGSKPKPWEPDPAAPLGAPGCSQMWDPCPAMSGTADIPRGRGEQQHQPAQTCFAQCLPRVCIAIQVPGAGDVSSRAARSMPSAHGLLDASPESCLSTHTPPLQPCPNFQNKAWILQPLLQRDGGPDNSPGPKSQLV